MHELHKKTKVISGAFTVKQQPSTCHMANPQKKTAAKKNLDSPLQLSFFGVEIN